MNRNGMTLLAASMIGLAACSDSTVAPAAPETVVSERWSRTGTSYMSNYVAVGTSLSMGWASDGVVATSQNTSWPKQLANQVGVGFTVPGIAAPGCQPPFAAPLISFKRVDNSSAAVRSPTCAPNLPDVTLPTQNLAIENATTAEGLNATPATASMGRGPVTSRVLQPGMTQITTMKSLHPTFVSVEFGGNELLPAQIGVLIPRGTYTPLDDFKANYAKVIDAVKETRAKALLVTIRTDLRRFPTIRTGRELAAQRGAFLQEYNVSVNADCDASENYIFVRGKVPTAVANGLGRRAVGAPPFDLSCANNPAAGPFNPDYILTPADIAFLNQLGDDMSAEIERHAKQNGYAVFPLGVLYNFSKWNVPFAVKAYMESAAPYGDLISLDGVHPSAKGQSVFAYAARFAITAKYGSGRNHGGERD